MKQFRQSGIKTFIGVWVLVFAQLGAPGFREPKGILYYDGLITHAVIEETGKIAKLVHEFAKTGNRIFLDRIVHKMWKNNKMGLALMGKLVDECMGKYNIAVLEQENVVKQAWKAGKISSAKEYEELIAATPKKLFEKAYSLVAAIERRAGNQVFVEVFRNMLKNASFGEASTKLLAELATVETANLLGEDCHRVRDLRPRVIALVRQ
jgi:hypothetical protein